MEDEVEDVAVDEEEELRDARAQLEALKVKTLHNMVQQITLSVGDAQMICPFLYLTNRQAASMSQSPKTTMVRAREQLGLGEPKMVIRLLRSQYGGAYWKAFPYWRDRFPHKTVPECNDDDEFMTEHQLLLFAKEVILPLAMKTNALIIGSEMCDLTMAFIKACFPVQQQLGDACPFSLLIFARAHMFDIRSHDSKSVVSNFRTSTWSTDIPKAMKMRYGSDEAFWPQDDLFQGNYRLIMFECLTNGGIAETAPNQFVTDFVASLMHVPVIAMQTYGSEKMDAIPVMRDHINRGMPLMIIDSRKRGAAGKAMFPRSSELEGESDGSEESLSALREIVQEAKTELGELSEQLHAAGKADWYSSCTLAFIKEAVNHSQHTCKSSQDMRSKQAHMWLWQAIDDAIARKSRLRQMAMTKPVTGSVTPRPPKAHSEEQDLLYATDAIVQYVGREMEWELTQRQSRFHEALANLMTAKTWVEFSDKLNEHWCALRGCAFHFYGGMVEFETANPWARIHDNKRNTNKGRKHLVVNLDHVDLQDTQGLEVAKQKLKQLLDREFANSSSLDKKNLTAKAFARQDELWLATYDLLKSPSVFTGSLHDIRVCRGKLSEIAQIEYLPALNSLAALVLLRRAWTLHDVFVYWASTYKYMAKMIYLLLLVATSLNVTIVTLMNIKDDAGDDFLGLDISVERQIMLCLSLGSAFIKGLDTLVGPGKKWLSLRGAALLLESEIWRFRARMGEYGGDASAVSSLNRNDAEKKSEARLADNLNKIQAKLQQGSGLTKTSFYSAATTVALERRPGGQKADAAAAQPQLRGVVPEPSAVDSPGRDASSTSFSDVRAFSRSSFKVGKRLAEERTSGKNSQHGQFDVGRFEHPPPKEEDNFHSPIAPEQYIKFRLVPALEFYRRRLPKYARLRFAFKMATLCASIATALIAGGAFSRNTPASIGAIIASFISAIASWEEFSGVEEKLDRYSNVATMLENVLVQWQSLAEVDQSNMKLVERLVLTTEQLITSEFSAWMSDAQAVMAQAQEAEEKGRGDAGRESDEDGGDEENGPSGKKPA